MKNLRPHVNPIGRVNVQNVETGEVLERWAVDAREMIESGHYRLPDEGAEPEVPKAAGLQVLRMELDTLQSEAKLTKQQLDRLRELEAIFAKQQGGIPGRGNDDAAAAKKVAAAKKKESAA